MSKVLVLTVIEADYQWDDNELVVKASDYDQLKADSEVVADLVESRLAENLRLKAENERLKLRLWDLEHSEVDHVLKERDTLRAQLDEAREFLRYSADECIPSLGREIKDWLEANKA